MGWLDKPILTRESVAPVDTLTGWTNQARTVLSLADDPLGELGQVLKVVGDSSTGAGSFNYTWGSDQDFRGIHGFGLDVYVELPIDTAGTEFITYDSLRMLNNAQTTNQLIYDRPAGSNVSPWQARFGHQYHYLPMSMLVDTGPHNAAATRSIRLSWPVDHTLPTTVYVRGLYKNDLFRPAFGLRIDDVRATGLTWAEDNILDHYDTKYPLSLAVAGSLTSGVAPLATLQDHVSAGRAYCFNHTYLHSNLANSSAAVILAEYEDGRDYLDENGLTTVKGGIKSSEILIAPFGAIDTLARQVLTDAGCKLIVGVNATGSNHRRMIATGNVLDRSMAIGTGYVTTASYVEGNIRACADSGEQTFLTLHDVGSGGTNQATDLLAKQSWAAISKRLKSREADWVTFHDWAIAANA